MAHTAPIKTHTMGTQPFRDRGRRHARPVLKTRMRGTPSSCVARIVKKCEECAVPLPLPPMTFEPIGIVRSPFVEKVDAPRQAGMAPDVEATIELFAGRGLEH